MQTLTERAFELSPPGGVLDSTAIGNLFPGASVGARKLLVHRATRAGEILRLKPGLYILHTAYRQSSLHPFSIAAMVHSPSHVSLESALAHHGLIPEAVYQVASVTVARSRTLRTPLGVFSYHRVPARNPRAGVCLEKLSENSWAFVATPVRAIADMVYLDKHVSWKTDGLSYLTKSLRIEEDDLPGLDPDMIDEVRESIADSRTTDFLSGLREELHDD